MCCLGGMSNSCLCKSLWTKQGRLAGGREFVPLQGTRRTHNPLGEMQQRNCSSTKHLSASTCSSLTTSFRPQEITVTRARPSSSRWEGSCHPKFNFWSSSILGGWLCFSKSWRNVVTAGRTWRYALLHAEGVWEIFQGFN